MQKELVGVNCLARELKARDLIKQSSTSSAYWLVVGRPRVQGDKVFLVVRESNRYSERVGERQERKYEADYHVQILRWVDSRCPVCGEEFPHMHGRYQHQVEEGHWSIDYPGDPRGED